MTFGIWNSLGFFSASKEKKCIANLPCNNHYKIRKRNSPSESKRDRRKFKLWIKAKIEEARVEGEAEAVEDAAEAAEAAEADEVMEDIMDEEEEIDTGVEEITAGEIEAKIEGRALEEIFTITITKQIKSFTLNNI